MKTSYILLFFTNRPSYSKIRRPILAWDVCCLLNELIYDTNDQINGSTELTLVVQPTLMMTYKIKVSVSIEHNMNMPSPVMQR